MIKEGITTRVVGQLFFYEDGVKIFEKTNAINNKNMARVLARGLANEDFSNIARMAFGNGGTYTDTTGNIIYNTPNVSTKTSTLYNQTWFEDVESASADNSVASFQSPTELTAIVDVTAVLTADEPIGQFDGTNPDANNPANPETNVNGTGADYNFDEAGLQVKNPAFGLVGEPEYLTISHLTFNPIQKNSQREQVLIYRLTISVSGA